MNQYTKKLAVETLHVYTTLCRHFVIVAPDAVHRDSQEPTDKASYFSRGWCRLEQAHSPRGEL